MENLRKQVISMQHKIKDLMDAPKDPAAQQLNREVQGLEDDLQVSKTPRTIEDRVKRILQIIRGNAKAARIMNYEHLDMLEQWFENLRQQLRKM